MVMFNGDDGKRVRFDLSICRKEKEKKVLLIDGVSIEVLTSTWLNFMEYLSFSPQPQPLR